MNLLASSLACSSRLGSESLVGYRAVEELAGHYVTTIDEHSFPNDAVEHFVLRPPVLSKNPLATNFRKLYVCRRT